MKKTLQLLALLALAALLIATGLKIRAWRAERLAALPPPAPAPWALRVSQVERGTLARGFPALAELIASREVNIRTQVAGIVLSMGPREGVAVAAGDELARIDVREQEQQRAGLSAQVAAARAEVERARDELQRQERLQERQLTTAQQLEATRTAWVAAREQVTRLEREEDALAVRIGYGAVTAPAAGIIAERLAEPGDAVQPGAPLFRLSANGAARLRVTLPQAVLEGVRSGTQVELTHGSETLSIPLNRVFPALDARAMGSAEADLDALPFGLPSGARLPARVILEQVGDALKVPQEALIRTGGGESYCFVLDDVGNGAHLRRVPVTPLLDGGSRVAVEGDIQPGQQVVVAHRSVLLRLRDGDPAIAEGVAP